MIEALKPKPPTTKEPRKTRETSAKDAGNTIENPITDNSDKLIGKWLKAGLKKPKSLCEICFNDIKLERHHIIPRSFDGLDNLENIVILCKGCHINYHQLCYEYYPQTGHQFKWLLKIIREEYQLRRETHAHLISNLRIYIEAVDKRATNLPFIKKYWKLIENDPYPQDNICRKCANQLYENICYSKGCILERRRLKEIEDAIRETHS